MGVPVMTEEEIERIGLYVKNHIGAWLEEGTVVPFSKDLLFSEKIVRVEEGIRHQGELLEKMLNQVDKRFEQVDKRFEQVDKRFEQMQENIDRRFDQVDKRFEEIRQDMNSRFEQVDKRFSHLQWTMGLGFTILAALMGIFNFY